MYNLGPDVWKSDLPEADRGIKVVGTPIGSDAFVANFCSEVLSEERQLLENIPKLDSLQMSWLLLLFCAVPRVNHLLRTVSPVGVSAIAKRHDDTVFEVFR